MPGETRGRDCRVRIRLHRPSDDRERATARSRSTSTSRRSPTRRRLARQIPGLQPADLQAPTRSRPATPAARWPSSTRTTTRRPRPIWPSIAPPSASRRARARTAASASWTSTAGRRYPAPNLGWGEEIALDLDMVSAACPRCSIVLVEANCASARRSGRRGRHGGRGRAQRRSATATTRSSGRPSSRKTRHYHHPGIADDGELRRPRLRHLSGRLAARDRGRRHHDDVLRRQLVAVGMAVHRATAAAPTSHARVADRDALPRRKVRRRRRGRRRPADRRRDVRRGAGRLVVAGGTSVGAPLVAAAYALSGHPAAPKFSYAHASAFRPVGAPGYQLITGLGTPAGVSGF